MLPAKLSPNNLDKKSLGYEKNSLVIHINRFPININFSIHIARAEIITEGCSLPTIDLV